MLIDGDLMRLGQKLDFVTATKLAVCYLGLDLTTVQNSWKEHHSSVPLYNKDLLMKWRNKRDKPKENRKVVVPCRHEKVIATRNLPPISGKNNSSVHSHMTIEMKLFSTHNFFVLCDLNFSIFGNLESPELSCKVSFKLAWH